MCIKTAKWRVFFPNCGMLQEKIKLISTHALVVAAIGGISGANGT